MQRCSVDDIMQGKAGLGSDVEVCGWVRTRRDSKAGLSFIAVSDGSCFASLQIVAPAALDNYESEVRHVSTGYAVRVHGKLVESPSRAAASCHGS